MQWVSLGGNITQCTPDMSRHYRIVRIISPWCIISPPPSSAQSYCIGIGRLYMVIRIISPPPVQKIPHVSTRECTTLAVSSPCSYDRTHVTWPNTGSVTLLTRIWPARRLNVSGRGQTDYVIASAQACYSKGPGGTRAMHRWPCMEQPQLYLTMVREGLSA